MGATPPPAATPPATTTTASAPAPGTTNGGQAPSFFNQTTNPNSINAWLLNDLDSVNSQLASDRSQLHSDEQGAR